MTLAGLKALKGRRGVSFSRDHYQQLLYIHIVAASSICPFDLFMLFCFVFSMLLMYIHKVFLKDNKAQWPDE